MAGSDEALAAGRTSPEVNPLPSSSVPISSLPHGTRKHRPGVTLTGGIDESHAEPVHKHTVLALGGPTDRDREPLANLGSPTFSPEMTGTEPGLDDMNGLDLPPPAEPTSPLRPVLNHSTSNSPAPSRTRASSASTDASQSPRMVGVRISTTHLNSNPATPPRQESPNHLMNPYTSLARRSERPSNASYDEDEHDEHPLILQLPRDLMTKATVSGHFQPATPPKPAPRHPFRHPMYISAVLENGGQKATGYHSSSTASLVPQDGPSNAADGYESDEDVTFSPKSMPNGLHTRPFIRIEPWIDAGRLVSGIFLRKDVVAELGLKKVGEAGTTWGVSVDKLSPIQLHLFTRHTILNDVYLLPAPFETHETYGGGIISIECLWACGLSVIIEAGVVYLQDSEASDGQLRGENS